VEHEIMRAADRRLMSKQERETARAKGVVRGEVQLTGFQIEGAAAVAGRFMDIAVDLDNHRRELATDDVSLNLLLGEIEANFIRQGKRIQSQLFDQWGLG